MSLKINIDAAAIAAQFKELSLEVQQDVKKGVANLAAITHAKVSEMAAQELSSSRKTFTDNLGFEEITDGIWVVSIDEKAFWIEEGIEPNKDMKPGLLADATRTSKDGHKYRVIPFEHSKAPSQLTPYAANLVNRIKYNLRKQGIPFKKIEKNSDGSPRLGKLHTLNMGGELPSSRANTPVLQGVNIYQSMTRTGNVRRDIFTFRTVTDGPSSQGKWIHPGYQAKHFLDRAADWAMQEWENNILPAILSKY